MLIKKNVKVIETYIIEEKPFELKEHIVIDYNNIIYDAIIVDTCMTFEYGVYKSLLYPGKTILPFSYLFENWKTKEFYIYGM